MHDDFDVVQPVQVELVSPALHQVVQALVSVPDYDLPVEILVGATAARGRVHYKGVR